MLSFWDRRAEFVSLTLMAFIAACGGGGGGASGDSASGGSAEGTMAAVVDESTAATITGAVAFSGAPVEAKAIDMSEESVCADKYSMPPMTQRAVVNDNGTLRNVFIYVKEGLGDLTFPTPSEPVVLDQDGCRYHPHVFGVQVGQDITIKNSDGVLHNINSKPSENRGFNISQPVVMETTRSFRTPEIGIPLECDVHGWMQAYVSVVEHPYFAVTGEDGSFSLTPLPPGTYVIEAWHDVYGTATQEVTVGENEEAEIAFTFGDAAA